MAASLIISLLSSGVPAHAADTVPGDNVLVNIDGSGNGGNNISANEFSQPLGVSYDGNLVFFTSNQTDLPNANTSGWSLYMRNISTSTTTRVDTSSTGVGGNGNSIGEIGWCDERKRSLRSLQ